MNFYKYEPKNKNYPRRLINMDKVDQITEEENYCAIQFNGAPKEYLLKLEVDFDDLEKKLT